MFGRLAQSIVMLCLDTLMARQTLLRSLSELNVEPTDGAVVAIVVDLSYDESVGGSVTLNVTRSPAVCCSMWDWVGIYQGGSRLSFVQSRETEQPSFLATLAIPAGGGTFTFAFSTSVDNWQVHDLGLELHFGSTAPAVAMEALIPSYWFPTEQTWDDFAAAVNNSGMPARRVTVILNPNSGNITYGEPSPEVWALWRSRAEALFQSGFRVLAYVNLCSEVVNFECASEAQQGDKVFSGAHGVQAEIDTYLAELGPLVAGLFLDDASHAGTLTEPVLRVTQYAGGHGLETVHNPGAISNDAVLFEAATVVVLRENTTPGTLNPWQAGFDTEKACMILHSVPEDMWRGCFATARSTGYKYFYATSAGYSSSPAYLEDMLRALAQTTPAAP